MKVSFYIKQEKRIAWDFFIILVIFYVAFEVPYDIFVGWNDHAAKVKIDRFICAVFFVDIALNCFTERMQTFSGFWGWRNIAGLFNQNLSQEAQLERTGEKPILLTTQPAIVRSYLKSGWFLIDFIAAFPFELLFAALPFTPMARTFRLARLGRILRLLRLVRFLKAFRILDIFNRHFEHRPALRRMIYFSLLVPWICFIHACLFYQAEYGNTVQSFGQAFHNMFFVFMSGEEPTVISTYGYLVSLSSLVCGMVFLGVFVGNFASFFDQFDKELIAYEEETREWQAIFRSYKNLFDDNMKNRILESVKRNSYGVSSRYENHARMIRGLDAEIEEIIRARASEIADSGNCYKTRKLSDHLNPKKLESIIE